MTEVIRELEQHRINIRMTYKELAAKAGLKDDTVREILQEHREPKLFTFTAIANCLGMKLHVKKVDD